MIIVRINGGLGNQMFQYAAARRLAHKHNARLKLDISELVDSIGYHIYGLRHFNIQADIASAADIIRFFPAEGVKRLSTRLVGNRFTRLLFRKVLKDNSDSLKRRYYHYNPDSINKTKLVKNRVLSQRFFHFDMEVLDAPDNVYMTGSFISERYFEGIKDIIKEEFSFRIEQSEKDIAVAKMIHDTESVSIHIRRGEVVQEAQNQTTYNFIGAEYFSACIDYINTHIRNPHFFVFSDDIEWVKGNFKISFPINYVDHNDDGVDYRVDSGSDFQDMRLMSQCKHNIITNSTFSWWGAWLNQNPNKIICAPKEFVRISNFDNKDILPNEWVKFKIKGSNHKRAFLWL